MREAPWGSEQGKARMWSHLESRFGQIPDGDEARLIPRSDPILRQDNCVSRSLGAGWRRPMWHGARALDQGSSQPSEQFPEKGEKL